MKNENVLKAELYAKEIRKLGVSVIIGYKVDGNLTAQNNESILYDNELNGRYFFANGKEYRIPTDKSFRYEESDE